MRYSATGSASPPNLVPHLSEAGMAVLTPSPEVLGGLPLGEEGDVVFTITPSSPGLCWVLLHLLLPEPDRPAVSKPCQCHSLGLLQQELVRGESLVKGTKEPSACLLPNPCPESTCSAVLWAREGFVPHFAVSPDGSEAGGDLPTE